MKVASRQFVLERKDFASLFEALARQGYVPVGPTLKDNSIRYAGLNSVEDLPIGYVEHTDGGQYRLEKTDAPYLFCYVVPANSPKDFLFLPKNKVLEIKKSPRKYEVHVPEDNFPGTAFIGLRPCEIAGLKVHDKTLSEGQYKDPVYIKRRQKIFIVAVNCTRSAETCFCASMNTGPKAESGYDLALTEVLNDNGHYFLIEAGSGKGEKVVKELPVRDASEDELNAAGELLKQTAENMKRRIKTEGLKELLYENFDSPHWAEIAQRCLTCGNCTLVCPTCFCCNFEDTTDLSGVIAERWRQWDSCFRVGHSYIHGGSVRASDYSRYRQWMTHKLAYWQDQFDVIGCVGCGRCITWCPVGIDITEEAAYFRKISEKITETK